MRKDVVLGDVGECGGGDHSPASPSFPVHYMDYVSKVPANSDDLASEPCETRTRDTLIKSQVLYQLS
jgi:hypothetical protein